MIPQEILTDNTYKRIKMINLKLTHSLTLHSGIIDHFQEVILIKHLLTHQGDRRQLGLYKESKQMYTWFTT